MRKLLSAALFIGAALAFTSCQKETENGPSYDLSKGLIIVNEGTEFGSISHYNPTTDVVTNDIFKTVNNREAGKVLQSVCTSGSNVYLVLNSSSKIEVINKNTSREVATITGLEGPRYMVANGTTGYVSLWGTDEVAVLDLTNNTVKQRIKVGPDPEGLLILNNMLYVANSNGATSTSSNNTVSVIDLKTNNIVKPITVKDSPKGFTVDKTGAIWVLCAGYTNYGTINTNSFLCKINPSDYSTTSIDLGSLHYDRIAINSAKDKLSFGGGWGTPGIFQMDITATTAPAKPLISGDFYGFAINPSNGEVMAMDTKVKDNHKMIRYNSIGEKIKEYPVGVFPNGGIFVQ